MSPSNTTDLSRRERQIMDIVYERGRATASDVHERLPDPPSYSAVRAMLRILESKGHLRHEQDGPRYVFLPVVAREQARVAALKGVLRNFFENSHEQLIAALLEDEDLDLSDEELKTLAARIERARKEGR